MVAIFTGAGTGFERGSGNVLGGAGTLGQAGVGRSGERVLLNAANGNVLVMQQDELLLGRGPDAAISRTYNSQGDLSDENGDNWRQSTDRSLYALTGTANTFGSTVKRASADGSVFTYSWNGTNYRTTDGAGAHDTITYSTVDGWKWTDGDSQVVETYGYHYRNHSYISEQRDPSGNTLTFAYAEGRLTGLRTSIGERIQYGWSGDAITEIRTYTMQAGETWMQTRTRYAYDSLGRLSHATVDLTPEDNSIADGRSYGSAYLYHGNSRLIAAIAQTDGTRVDFEYDVFERVTAVTQVVDATTTRVTRLAYNSDFTVITDPSGQMTRLDFAAGDFALPGQAWNSSNLSRQRASINGTAATRYTVQTAGAWSAVAQALMVEAGETVSFGVNLQAVGDVTTHDLGLYLDQVGWGSTGSSTARIVSGPGSVQLLTGGFWRVVGLSATEGTRVEITRTYDQGGPAGAYFYVDQGGGFRAGGSMIVGGQTLVRSGTASSLDRMDATKWTGTNLARTPDTAINGAPTYKFAVKTAGAAAHLQRNFTARAGETYSFVITLKALGAYKAHHLGLGGTSSSWGPDTLASARILSGPGTLAQQAGGYYAVSGLSTTEATSVIVTRTFTRDEAAYARLFVALAHNEPAGAGVLVTGLNIVGPVVEPAAARMLTKITAPAAEAGGVQQVTQFAYNGNGDVVSVADAAGIATTMTYDASGNLLTTTDRLGNVVTRTYDARNQLLRTTGTAVSGDGAAAVSAINVYDSASRLRYAISAEGRVTRNQYEATGQLLRTDAFTGQFWAGTGTQTEAIMDAWVAGLSDKSARMTVRYEYDARGEVSRIVREGASDASGEPVATQGYSETILIRDPSGRLLERVTGGKREVFIHDGLGRMIGSTDVRGATTSFTFDDAGPQTVVTLASGAVQTSTYNRTGELIATTEAGLYSGTGSTSYRYDRMGRVRIAADAFGKNRYVVYDRIGRKTGEVDPFGRLTEYRYDRNDRLVASVAWSTALSAEQMALLADPLGDVDVAVIRPAAAAADGWNWMIYDREGRVLQRIDATGSSVVYDYDAAGRLLKQTAYANRLTVDPFKAAPPAIVTRPTTDAERDVVTRTFYDRDGNVSGVLDGEGYLSRTRHDAAGNRIEATRFARRTTATLRAAGSFNQLLADVGTGATDRTVRHAYDGQGLLRYSVDTANRVTEYVHAGDRAGDATAVVRQTIVHARPLAPLASYGVAAIGQALAGSGASADPANRRGFAVHDDRGNLTFAIDAGGAVTGYGYDVSGNVVRTIRYAATYATATLPTHAAMAGWAGVEGGNADNRLTRAYHAARGELRFTVDPLGYVTRYDYDAAGRNVAVVRFDTAMAGATDATTIGDVAAWQNGTSVITATSYDDAGRVFETTDTAGTVTRYVYNVNGTVQSTIGAYGTTDQVRTRFDYDAAGRVLARTDDADGIATRTRYSYDGFGNLLTQTAPDNTSVTRFTYDREGRMLTRTDALGQVRSFDYDSFGQRVRVTDERGRATYSYYDAAGRVTMVRDAESYLTETTYTAFDQIETVTRRAKATTAAAAIGTPPMVVADAGDAVTRFVHDRLGRVVRTIDAQGHAENARYNGFGEVVQATNKLGGVTARRYDRRGQLVSETVAKAVFNAAGTRIVVPLSIATLDTVYYASAYPDLASKAGDSAWLQWHWENYGWRERRNPNAVFDTDFYLSTYSDIVAAGVNPLTHYAIAGAGEGRAVNATTVAGAVETGGTTTHHEYDARGNRTRLIEAADLPEQRVTEFIYDVRNRLIEKRGSDAAHGLPGFRDIAKATEKYRYDRHDNLIRRTDANGRHSFFYYDALDRKVGEVDATGAYVAYAYDRNGGLSRTRAYATRLDISGVDPAVRPAVGGEYRETSYVNDAIGRRVSGSIAGVRAGAWDVASGNYVHAVAVLTDSIGYDATGNVVRTTDATGASVFFYYDGLGRKVAQVDQENHLTEWTLDAEGNTLAERRYAAAVAGATEATRPAGVQNDDDRVTEFTYDRNGRRLTETRLRVTAWAVDPTSGALTSATGDATVTYAYNGLGLVTSRREATGDTTRYTYDRAGLLIGEERPNLINSMSDEAIPLVAYFHDGIDNLVRTVEGTDRVTTNQYDAAGRKIATVDAMGSERDFYYDRAGNLLGEGYIRRRSSGTVLREGVSYRYDAVGRLRYQNLATWTSQGGNATSWTNVGDYTDIAYNAFGEVVSRAVNGNVQERHDYDAAGRMWRSTGGDGALRYFVHDGAGRRTLTLESNGAANVQNLGLDEILIRATVNGKLSGRPDTGIVVTIGQYDRRGQATAMRSPGRELGGTHGVADLLTTRSYTAFGEIASESDTNGDTITYVHNRMGRVISITRPGVLIAGVDTQFTSGTTREERYYDISGRLAGAKDANGNISTRRLAGGTGYGGAAELVTGEYHADGGRVFMRYDDAGNRIRRTDEMGRATEMQYDRLGRLLTTSNVNAGDVAHSYTYDSLGRRLTHVQTGRAATDREVTDYDIAGRVVSTRAFGGDVTTNSYAWDGAITAGTGTTGGWRQTTTYANGKTTIEAKDVSGRMTARTDMGGNVATTTYDQAGRISRITGLEEQNFTWFNTGQLATQTSDLGWGHVRATATFGYDGNGNKVAETFTRDGQLYRNTTASFDRQGRMIAWYENGGGSVPAASMQWLYDANGNIAQTMTVRPRLDQHGAVSGTTTDERWFRHDSMNRVTLDGGRRGVNGIERGDGTQITYHADGTRATSITDVTLTGMIEVWEQRPGHHGDYVYREASYRGQRRETYRWRDDGQLAGVAIDDTGYYDGGTGSLISSGDYTKPAGSAIYFYDALGRQVRQVDGNAAGTAVYDRTVTYDLDGRGLVASERTVTVQGRDTVTTTTTNAYGTGNGYALGAVTQATAANAVRNGGNTTNTSTTTTNLYQWRDGAQLQRSTTSKAGVADSSADYGYAGVGQLEAVTIGGSRPRTVTFVSDLSGQAIRRDEADGNTSAGTGGDPHEIWYRHGGREIGYVGNNGAAARTYGESIDRRGAVPSSGAFAAPGGQPHGSGFAATIDRIDSYGSGSAGRSYTVQGGETLSGIAQQLWGDASLWYKLAAANGLSDDGGLMAGQVLSVPAGIVRSTYDAESYRPYDPGDVLGDLNPVTPTPRGRRNDKCGAFGRILLVAVAVAVTIASQGTLAGAAGSALGLGSTGSAIVGGALAGAAGSIASQGVGLATGIQDRFSWNGVAMGALSGAVGGGVGKLVGGTGFVAGAVRGALGNAITQGAAMAVGLQQRFDWVGVAVGGVVGGVGELASARLPGSVESFGNRLGSGLAGGIAGAATRSILTGTSFGDNVLAVLPDVIGATVGAMVGQAVTEAFDHVRDIGMSPGEAALVPQAERSGRAPIGTDADMAITRVNDSPAMQADAPYVVKEAEAIYEPRQPGVVYAVENGDELVVTGDLSKRTSSIDYSLMRWLAPPESTLFPSGSITSYSNPLGRYFSQQMNSWQGFHFAGRDYRSIAEAQAAGMPVFTNPPSWASQYEARRDAAFLGSIGPGGFGLGSIAYVMGGSPEAIDANTNLDIAIGGLAQGAALRPAGRMSQSGASRTGIEPLSGRLFGTSGAVKGEIGEGIVYLRTDTTEKLAPYVGQTTEANELARQAAHARAYPNSRFEFETLESGILRGSQLDIAEHNAIQARTGGVAARRSSAVSNQRDPVGPLRRPGFGLPEPR